MKILIVLPHWLGDAVLATSVIHGCIAQYPQSQITVVCRPDFTDLISGCDQIQSILPIDRSWGRRHWFVIWSKVYAYRWHQVIDLRGTGLGFLLRTRHHKIWKRSCNVQHRVQQYQSFMGFDRPYDPLLWINPYSLKNAQQGLKTDQKLIILAPTANSRHKEWGEESFQELIQQWVLPSKKMRDYTYLIVGNASERARVSGLLSFFAQQTNLNCIDAVGGYTLGALAVLFSEACFFLGNDSGPMHLSAALGVPTVGLFGPTSESIYGPWGGASQKTWALCPEEPKDPALRDMRMLSVPYVHQRIEKIWASLPTL